MQKFAFLLLLLAMSSCGLLFMSSCSAIGPECISTKLAYTIRVSKSKGGGRHFTRVQDAINAVPSNNRRWIKILVDPGIYREQVQIPDDKQCVILQGNSASNTIISFDAHSATDTSATLSAFADNFLAKNIAFVNTYGRHSTSLKQAAAVRVYGDKSAFYNCGFVGIQDTLWDVVGRHYFKSCYIEGAIDFIWGTGQSVYENCRIKVVAGVLGGAPGYITAQGRESANDPSGFVFMGGLVYGSGPAYLGRAYRAYSRVIFRGTNFANVIMPLGWDAWSFVHHEDNLMYAEANCRGAGADLSHRVAWMKRLNAAELSKYTVPAFIDQDGWIAKQPA